MPEELPVARTEVVQSRFPLRGNREAMLGATTPAGVQHVALATEAGQGSLLVRSKSFRHRPFDHLPDTAIEHIAQPVFGVDIVVAGEERAVVFQSHGAAALLCEDTNRRRLAHPGGQGPLEVHDEDIAHVLSHPLLVDGYQEVTVRLGFHGPWCDLGVRLLPVEPRRRGQ